MLIYDEPLTERSTPIIKAATCRFPEGGLFNGGSTLCMINTIGRVGGGGGGENISVHMTGRKFDDWESSYHHHHLHTVTNIRHYQKINVYFHHCNISEKIQHLITKARHLGFHQELEIRLKPRSMVIFCAWHVKYHLNKHFAYFVHKLYFYCWKKLKKHAFSLKNGLTTCFLWRDIS